MPRTNRIPSARPRVPESAPPAQPEPSPTEPMLSKDAISAIKEGRADHAAGRTFSMAEIKRELERDP